MQLTKLKKYLRYMSIIFILGVFFSILVKETSLRNIGFEKTVLWDLIKIFMAIIFYGLWTYYCWFSKDYASYAEYKKRMEEQYTYMGWYYGSKFVFWGTRIIVLVFLMSFVMAFFYRLFNVAAVALRQH